MSLRPVEPMVRNVITFEYEYILNMEAIRESIRRCENRHMQQVAYSTFHDALTQICYTCRKIRSNIIKNEQDG